MTHDALRWLARAHGALAWAATLAAAAAFAASLGRRGPGPGPLRRWIDRIRPVAVATAAALLSTTFASGLPLDLPYRGRLRQQVFISSTSLGWWFERKLHFAFGAVVLAWCGLALLAASALAARRTDGPGSVRPKSFSSTQAAELARGGRVALASSAALALLAAISAEIVARRHPF